MTNATMVASPLDALHRELGARMVPFAGFMMPIQYAGILREHNAVRKRAGLFDLSHMAQFEIFGDNAAAWLDGLTVNRVSTIKPFGARYNLVMNEHGGVRDDIIIYRLPDRYLVVANAANAEKIAMHFASHAAAGNVRVENQHTRRALIALQGPASRAILQPRTDVELEAMAYYTCAPGTVLGQPALVARTGYTGEDGFELFLANNAVESIFRQLLDAGKDHGLEPTGLGSRDILRLEAGMPLYGHELGEELSPVQSGQTWAVKLDKGDFIGRDALLARKDLAEPRIIGLQLQGKVPAREGYAVLANGKRIGDIRSAAIAPAVGNAQIATALVDAAYADLKHTLDIEIRGTLYPASVVALPFYRRSS